ncbi:7-cyano-7-deazaguanine synthase [Rickettsiales endosymbiont of Paramecium tredecaurelia]|uniref:7-cyano-7-deazaguanine synthase QueC n=1 Tax=Candidatus Sarmatiella mevalonica TaxID=2770581 RepID=UPI0019225966|nr:7-cyano-7-deazaguanine synthase QueC [Candidatus Sarmatiella mevalonica]MBL3284530.1 7-cyano-7-deazaguanine synthase [Candidatus Sarmatiella mevalonica]
MSNFESNAQPRASAILLASGGADSATVLAGIQHEQIFNAVHVLSFCYDQRHSVELTRLKELLQCYACVESHTILTLPSDLFSGSTLVNKDMSVPKYHSIQQLPEHGIPSTYVPGRNTIFLSYAFSLAQTTNSGAIFVGVHDTDRAHYPDCRAEYIQAFANLLKIASPDQEIKLYAPLLHLSKVEVIARGLSLGVDFAKTISCYDPIDDLSCGSCQACLLRLDAFARNNSVDPVKYLARA